MNAGTLQINRIRTIARRSVSRLIPASKAFIFAKVTATGKHNAALMATVTNAHGNASALRALSALKMDNLVLVDLQPQPNGRRRRKKR
jgi:hypothetical protein